METGLKIYKSPNGLDDTEYRVMIGALLYLSKGTQSDIYFSVHYMSRFQNCSTEQKNSQVKRIFKYVNFTKMHSLLFNSRESGIDAYVDTSHAPDVGNIPIDENDLSVGKSITGYLIKVNGDLIQ